MKELKRYKLTADSMSPNWDAVEDPDGHWIFDPGHKFQQILKERNELYEVLELAYANLGATAVSEHTFGYVRSKMRQALESVNRRK